MPRAVVRMIALLAGLWSGLSAMFVIAADGESIYAQKCIGCHGVDGRGTSEVPQPLFGDRPTADLADVISRTMPDGESDQCVGADAVAVAEYMQRAFYSPEAQARINPPSIELSRLTVSQYRNAVADLVSSFRWFARPNKVRGLKGEYFASRSNRRDRRILERVDGEVDFQFGSFSPDGEKIREEEFSMRWQGSVIIPETGWYEFILQTENAGRLYVNDPATPLIDVWVKSGTETEFRASRFLLAGRIYPITLEWFKFKESTASVSLQWKPPHGVQQVIPARQLTTESSPQVLVVETPFPPDDRSSGYERGNSISREWDEATTYAALETADRLIAMLPAILKSGESDRRRSRGGNRGGGNEQTDADRAEKLKEFAEDFVERAFRRPLSDEQRQVYVDQQFERTKNPDESIRRVILLTLKSPFFLYRETSGSPDQFDKASRLSFALLNSIPDHSLLEAAKKGQLETDRQLREQAWRLANDPRASSRLTEFLRTWMNLEHLHEIDKNREVFPEFSPEIAWDMRTSLQLLVDSVVTSEDANFQQLLLSDSTFLNGRLAKFYGVPMEEQADFQLVQFESDRRAGILTHPFLLSGFAYQTTSSPIHRGVFLLRGVLGRALKPPPVAVSPTAPELAPDLTTRERVVVQTSPEMCLNCHNMINGLGFSLEHFDAVGRYRQMEQQKPIDASGRYMTRTGADVSFDGARELATFLAQNEETHRSFARQLFHAMVQQPILAYGPNSISELGDFFSQNDYNLKALMVEIACRSASFQISAGSDAAVAVQNQKVSIHE